MSVQCTSPPRLYFHINVSFVFFAEFSFFHTFFTLVVKNEFIIRVMGDDLLLELDALSISQQCVDADFNQLEIDVHMWFYFIDIYVLVTDYIDIGNLSFSDEPFLTYNLFILVCAKNFHWRCQTDNLAHCFNTFETMFACI